MNLKAFNQIQKLHQFKNMFTYKIINIYSFHFDIIRNPFNQHVYC